MWTTILGAIPWNTIFTLAIQLVLFVIKKSADHKEAEEAFLKFISEIENQGNLSNKIGDKYRAQIKAARERLKKESGNE